MALEEYRKSCWPKYNPYYGEDKEERHLDYLNCIWREGDYANRKTYIKKYLYGTPLGFLGLNFLF